MKDFLKGILEEADIVIIKEGDKETILGDCEYKDNGTIECYYKDTFYINVDELQEVKIDKLGNVYLIK